MRSVTRFVVILCVVIAAGARQYSDAAADPRERPGALADPRVEGLAEFLSWAHPGGEGCDGPTGIEVISSWGDVLRVRYELPCESGRHMEAILATRGGKGVWQVWGGFEASRPVLENALAVAGVGDRPGGDDADPGIPATLSPPPEDRQDSTAGSPLWMLRPARPERMVQPERPERVGRARLLGQARVELLVDIAADGRPRGARPLRGPDPDLGMRRAAIDAVMKWRFRPARAGGQPVRSFAAFDILFEGLPRESSSWVHRALFRFEEMVTSDAAVAEEGRVRAEAGESLPRIAAELGPIAASGGTRDFVSAAELPLEVRKALHQEDVGELVGLVVADGEFHLLRKLAEVYFGIRTLAKGNVSYQIVHERNSPTGEILDELIRRDIAAYLAERMRREYMNEAARLMGVHQIVRETGQLRVYTDTLAEDEIRLLGDVVSAVIRAHEEFWKGIAPLRPFTEQILVFAFARQSDHDRLHRLWRDESYAPRSTEGDYLPTSRILAIPCEAMEGHLPVPYLMHEAIHMLNYERVYAPGIETSRWFEEGLANYFGFSQFDSELQIDPGTIRRSGRLSLERARIQFDPRTELREHLRLCRAEGPVPLHELLESDSDDPLWQEERSSRAYGASWTLVHFLLHGAEGHYRPTFLMLARREARGEGGADVFTELFGPDLDGLEAAWHAYEAGL